MAQERKEEPLITQGSGNIFADLGLPNANEHLEKAKLVLAIQRAITDEGLTQSKAAERMGIDQPQVSRILRGQYSGYSLERLYNFLNRFGHDITVTVSPRHPSFPGQVNVSIVPGP